MQSELPRLLTPSELEFLIYTYVYFVEHPKISLAVYKKFVYRFTQEGILQRNHFAEGEQYEVTEKGKVWIEEILSTPMPVQKWVSGRS